MHCEQLKSELPARRLRIIMYTYALVQYIFELHMKQTKPGKGPRV